MQRVPQDIYIFFTAKMNDPSLKTPSPLNCKSGGQDQMPRISKLAVASELAVAGSKVISNFQEFSVGKWGPFLVTDSSWLCVFDDLIDHHFPIENFKTLPITFEFDDVKL